MHADSHLHVMVKTFPINHPNDYGQLWAIEGSSVSTTVWLAGYEAKIKDFFIKYSFAPGIDYTVNNR